MCFDEHFMCHTMAQNISPLHTCVDENFLCRTNFTQYFDEHNNFVSQECYTREHNILRVRRMVHTCVDEDILCHMNATRVF